MHIQSGRLIGPQIALQIYALVPPLPLNFDLRIEPPHTSNVACGNKTRAKTLTLGAVLGQEVKQINLNKANRHTFPKYEQVKLDHLLRNRDIHP